MTHTLLFPEDDMDHTGGGWEHKKQRMGVLCLAWCFLYTWCVHSLHRAALRKQHITTAWHKSAWSCRTQEVQADKTDGVSVYKQLRQPLLLSSYCTRNTRQCWSCSDIKISHRVCWSVSKWNNYCINIDLKLKAGGKPDARLSPSLCRNFLPKDLTNIYWIFNYFGNIIFLNPKH